MRSKHRSALLTIEGLDAFDVIHRQWVTGGEGVNWVHQSTGIGGMGHTEGVAQLVGCHYEQVVHYKKKMAFNYKNVFL